MHCLIFTFVSHLDLNLKNSSVYSSSVNKALAYILDPEKTDDQLYVSSFGCAASDAAAKEFEWTRNLAAQQGMQMPKVIARHLIQSFDIGEVTPEMAYEIGKQFADECVRICIRRFRPILLFTGD